MVNRNAPTGLVPAFHLTGGTVRLQRYRIVSGYTVDIFTNDLVHQVGTGKNIEAGDLAADAPFIGVFAGVEWTDTDGTPRWSKYWPANTVTLGAQDAVALVYDDPQIVYTIQSDGPTGVADVGSTADIAYTAGSTSTGLSKTQLDDSDIGTGLNLKIYDIVDRVDNETGVANVDVLVLINEHSLNNAGVAAFEQIA